MAEERAATQKSQLMNHEGRISALESAYRHLATKADIESLRSELKTMRWSMGLTVATSNIIVLLALRG